MAPLAVAQNRFGMELLALLARQRPGANVLISPTSIALALSLLYNGAGGQTQEEMAATLQVAGMSLDEVNEAAARFTAALQETAEAVELAVANSLWANQTAVFEPEFLNRSQHAYQAEIRNLDFARAGEAVAVINQWVEEKTRDKIKDLLKAQDVNAGTLLVLVNALYFKGAWATPFNEAHTRSGPFHQADGRSQEVPLMRQTGSFAYLETASFQAVNLPYGNGRFSMLIALPRANVALADLPDLLVAQGWGSGTMPFREMEGRLLLPRFKIEYSEELTDPLQAMGMALAFTPEADFSALSAGPIWVSAIRHKTFLEVNELGAEAAAATAVVMTRAGMISQSFSMIVDRPFFGAIQDNSTGAVLFVGQVNRI
jgi:serine protease inhibitor